MKEQFCVNFTVARKRHVEHAVFLSEKLTSMEHRACEAHRIENRPQAAAIAAGYDLFVYGELPRIRR